MSAGSVARLRVLDYCDEFLRTTPPPSSRLVDFCHARPGLAPTG